VIAAVLLAAALGFGLGSVPFGWLLAAAAGHGDVRREGSGNIGATNVFRVAGPGLAALTLLLDAAKGAAAVALARAIGPAGGLVAPAACVGAIAGSVFTPWLGFRGGKGAATGAGALAVLAPLPLLASLAVFGAVAGIARRVSAGSLAAAISFPGWAALFRSPSATVAAGAAVALLLAWSHRENIARLAAGNEPKLGIRRSGGGAR
jgi:acyl phosphate:glycerol-3-phosphate acyltransferase